MLKSTSINFDKVFLKHFTHIEDKYKVELEKELLQINFNREILLSVILISIDIVLLLIDLYTSSFWTVDRHLFGRFSYFHFALLLSPTLFLCFIKVKDKISLNRLCPFKALHIFLTTSVLTFSSLIAVSNQVVNKFAFPYLIAMFCIASTLFLNRFERYLVFMLSFFIYIMGSFLLCSNLNELTEAVFFFTLLNILAFTVSSINYSLYVDSFIHSRIILQNSTELDRLYKVTEEALEKRTEELNEAVAYEKLRGAFFANISHELRTPLTVIFSAEQMLSLKLKEITTPSIVKDVTEYSKIIKQNCYRLTRLVANLIDITKIDAGYFQVYFQNSDIVKIVEDITLSVARHMENRDIELIFDTNIEELQIACDPDKIERIMLNLLSNAIKFTPQGGKIFVNLAAEEDFVKIYVIDTGIGVPSNMRDSIFERFVQVDKTISRNREGSGIGLSLVKSLVEMHGGTVSLISEENKGSEFIFTLPRIKVSEENPNCETLLVSEEKNVEKIKVEFSDIYD